MSISSKCAPHAPLGCYRQWWGEANLSPEPDTMTAETMTLVDLAQTTIRTEIERLLPAFKRETGLDTEIDENPGSIRLTQTDGWVCVVHATNDGWAWVATDAQGVTNEGLLSNRGDWRRTLAWVLS